VNHPTTAKTGILINDGLTDAVSTSMSVCIGSVPSTGITGENVACLRNCNVDKPRNLAKSVTVE